MFIQRNVDYQARKYLSAWRKIAIGTWRTVGDPSVYGIMELRAEKALEYIEELSQRTGKRITITHFTGKCVAETMRKHSGLNCVLRFGFLFQRKCVDIFFQVASDVEGKDLSGLTVRDADQKSIVDIAEQFEKEVKSIRVEGDTKTYKIKKTFALIPAIAVAWMLKLSGFIAYKLNIWSPLFGTPRDPFGSVMITNVGSLGINTAFAPLVPYSHCPCVLVLSAIEEKAVVENGKVVVGKVMQICATFDHRLIDGIHASQMTRSVKAIFENPRAYFEQQG